jgi:hypothetical protein
MESINMFCMWNAKLFSIKDDILYEMHWTVTEQQHKDMKNFYGISILITYAVYYVLISSVNW